MMEIIFRILLLLFLLLFGVRVSIAQPAAHPLLTFFEAIPPSAAQEQGSLLSYIDYDVILGANETPALNAALSADEHRAITELGQWRANMMRIQVGDPLLLIAFFDPDDTLASAFGFSAWDIDQLVTVGQPPTNVDLMLGDFSYDAAVPAFSARGYAEAEVSGVPTLCSIDGCDQGFMMNMALRDPTSPFGGNLGVRPPFAFLPDGMLITTRDVVILGDLIAAEAGARRSLADDLQWNGLAGALTDGQWGLLGQAIFVTPLEAQYMPNIVNPNEGAAIEAILTETGDLPPFHVAALADYDAGTEQVHLIAAVYTDVATAEAAAAILNARMTAFDARDLLAEVGATPIKPLTVAIDGGAVALAGVRYPYVDIVDQDALTTATQPGSIYRAWTRALYQRGFVPLLLR